MTKIESKPIVFTGGGSAGHVTPSLPIIKLLIQDGRQIIYIGSCNGIERTLIQKTVIPYEAILSARLYRYATAKNLLAPLLNLFGVVQSFLVLVKHNPSVVFSKGGFVSAPVAFAAWLLQIPVVLHESDLTPGLANRFAAWFATTICVTFPETRNYFVQKEKVVYTGCPVRDELMEGTRERGLTFLEFTREKPVILILGGSLGAQAINEVIRAMLPRLLNKFQVVHICGEGKTDASYAAITGYRQFEYMHAEFADVLAAADLVVSRAGSNSIYELLVLRKPHILVPLPRSASRGDQYHNAEYFEKKGFSKIILQEHMTEDTLFSAIMDVYNRLDQVKTAMNNFVPLDATLTIAQILTTLSKPNSALSQ